VDICRKKSIEEGQNIVSPGSDGAELVSELKPNQSMRLSPTRLLKGEPQQLEANEWVIYKPRWGAFFYTKLEKMLSGQNISTLVVTGCNFPNCPRTTVYEASERDYRTALASDAVSGLYPQGEQELKNIGVAILKTKEIVNRSLAQQ
jgi:nicotinamidase-related amidase